MSESEIKSKGSKGELLDRLRATIDGVLERDRPERSPRPSRKPPSKGAGEPLNSPFDYIQQSRRVIRMRRVREAGQLIQDGLERYQADPHLLLEWSKFLEHQQKDYAQALEYALKVPDEIEGASNRDRRIHRLQRRAKRILAED